MATAKRTGNKQPANDPALKQATDTAVKQGETGAQTGNLATAKSPDATVPDASPPAYQGHDRR